MSSTDYSRDPPGSSSSARPSKRKRGSSSPEVGRGTASPGGAGGGAGPSSSKRSNTGKSRKGKDKAEDEDDDREPTTEEDSDEEEPSTQEEDDSMIVEQPRRSTRGTDEPPVLNLTDEGDDTASSPAPFASGSFRPVPLNRREGESFFPSTASITADSSSDDEGTKPRPSRRDKKGKGKARAASSPLPPAADKLSSPSSTSDPPTVPSAPLGPDGEPLRTLNHLTCPICFGPPAPLALTSCGHAFCAPCLHASLVAGPALTPPPAGPGGAQGGGLGRHPAFPYPGAAGARGRARARGGASGAGGRDAADADDDDGDPDLNKHCPVCRTALRGGWGKSLRGLVLRMGPATKAT
ncbi:hypothetical protein JCM6882_005883 [Rhodosporidiobolus microsporus]